MNGTEPKKSKVAYLGPVASYSHQAALACFGNEEYLLEPQSQVMIPAPLDIGAIPGKLGIHLD